tara:strand:- start:365 stop:1309 length:945 start_codon:yes stop_codon:yes gene_type:complete
MINEKKKNYIILLIKLVLFFLSCYLIYKNISSEKNFYSVFKDIELQYLLIIFFLTTVLIFIQIYIQFKTFLKIKKIKINFNYYSKIFFNSQLASIILPHSGLVYKAYKLNKFGLPYKDFLNIKLFLAWFYLSYFFLLYSVELIMFGRDILEDYLIMVFFVGISLSSSIFILPFIFNRYAKSNFTNTFIQKIYNFILNVILSPLNYNKLKLFNFLISYGLISHVISFIIIFLFFLALNLNLNFSLIVLFFVVNSFLDQVPITPRNLAVSELIFGIISSQVGLGFEFGVAIKLFLRIFFFINLIVMALIYNIVKDT